MLHESNAFPGKAVKMLVKYTDVIMVSFEDAIPRIQNAKKVVLTGTPTRCLNHELSLNDKVMEIEKYNLNPAKPTVLIFGGSQGAKRINDSITDVIINKQNSNYQFIWATGPTQYEVVKEKLKENDIDIENVKNAKVVPYIYNMEELMNASDLIVCRSGALTITEIAIVQKPAIFIPLPSAGANRQEDNARVMEKLNAAKVILNDEICSDIINKYINEIVSDKDNMIKMGKNASSIAVKNVEEKIYDEIKKTLNKK